MDPPSGTPMRPSHAHGAIIEVEMARTPLNWRETAETGGADGRHRAPLPGRTLRQAAEDGNRGMLAGGVAHDFNNLLTIISGYSQLILNTLARATPSLFGGTDLESREARGTLTGQLLGLQPAAGVAAQTGGPEQNWSRAEHHSCGS